ncbi:glucose-fructose oxidoreductase domain-containing protein 1 isoform X1 [Physeter macrocephalus]|uniref:Glucose-fructose oxidoreductase domain-containing protein 1 isoform X1 n=1 Tax=Physeter macrocephalus TaxID=9755 RepID=A0A9W2W8E2_PHYMC|nr:glucose-fructose oxidoreductase domain-containing protein 1 isoform X1 [Physeter catodon]
MLPGVGVFGTSLTARVIIPLLKDEGFAVKALWGRTQEEAEELAKEMSVPFYTSRIDEVLLHQDVDLVCINLPPPLTRQIAVKTLVHLKTQRFAVVPVCHVGRNSREEKRGESVSRAGQTYTRAISTKLKLFWKITTMLLPAFC